MFRRKTDDAPTFWIATSEIPTSPAHTFYQNLDAALTACQFGAAVRRLARRTPHAWWGLAGLAIAPVGTGESIRLWQELRPGTPVIAIPPKGHAEAERNAAELGYRFGDVGRLKELISEKLALGRLPPVPTGNDQAVDRLWRFLEEKAPG